MRVMGSSRDRVRLLAVATAYVAAYFAFRRAFPFSVASPWFVFVAMVCFLGLAAMARPVVPIRMPRWLRAVRPWETQPGIYRALRVPAFGRLLQRTPLRLLNTDVYLAGGGGTARLSRQLEAAEASHFWDAMLVLPYMAHLALQGAWTAFLWFSLAQVLINAYPIMHLRLARHRLERVGSRKPSPRERSG
jgi:hypothetical protein